MGEYSSLLDRVCVIEEEEGDPLSDIVSTISFDSRSSFSRTFWESNGEINKHRPIKESHEMEECSR
jgi:hypothetical protein